MSSQNNKDNSSVSSDGIADESSSKITGTWSLDLGNKTCSLSETDTKNESTTNEPDLSNPNDYIPDLTDSDTDIEEVSNNLDKNESIKNIIDQIDAGSSLKIIPELKKLNIQVEFRTGLPSIKTRWAQQPPLYVYLPDYITMEAREFDPEKYESASVPEDQEDPKLRELFLRDLKSTIRWRTQDGVKMSNARLARWRDNSWTLHIGADVFEVVRQQLPSGESALYVQEGSFYYAQSAIKEKLVVRTVIESSLGKASLQNLRERAIYMPKHGPVKLAVEFKNPAIDRKERIREENAKLRLEDANKRREAQRTQRRKSKGMRNPNENNLSDEDEHYENEVVLNESSDEQSDDEFLKDNSKTAAAACMKKLHLDDESKMQKTQKMHKTMYELFGADSDSDYGKYKKKKITKRLVSSDSE